MRNEIFDGIASGEKLLQTKAAFIASLNSSISHCHLSKNTCAPIMGAHMGDCLRGRALRERGVWGGAALGSVCHPPAAMQLCYAAPAAAQLRHAAKAGYSAPHSSR